MDHTIDPTLIHHAWDRTLEPALTIASGDTVHYDLRMAGHGQIAEGDGYEQAQMDFDTLYHLSGPLFVDDARPGDTLRIEILELEPGDWGWASVLPGLGLLPDEPAQASAFPPHKGGGNMDTRHLTAGSTLWLPIWCDGALFSCGDPHAAQGDGEVCVTAVECPMRATLRFTVEHRTIPGPRFETGGALLAIDESAGHFGAMGIDADLMSGARAAVRNAIDWLVDEHGLERREAYVLCSLAGDLKILEIVDSGVWNVGFTIPLSIFP
jgi:acetamidase/formamidase